MKNVLLTLSLTVLSLSAISQTVTVTLPDKYTADDLIKVEVSDSGHIYAFYKVNEFEQKKQLCSTLSRVNGYGVYPKAGDPLYKVCLAAEKSVKLAMKKN